MKKSLLFCIFTIAVPTHSMQLLRTGIMPFFRQATINRGSTIASWLSVMQTKKTTSPQLSFFKTEQKQSYDKHYSYSNNNSNQDRSWQFNWGKSSSSIPTLSGFLWFTKKEDDRRALIEKDIKQQEMHDIEYAKHLITCSNILENNQVEHLLDLLSSSEILKSILDDQFLRNQLTILLAKYNLGTRKEITIAAQLVNLYPEQAQLFCHNLDADQMSYANGTLDYQLINNRKVALNQRKGNFNLFIAQTLSTMNHETSILFAKSILAGIASSNQKDKWSSVIENLIYGSYFFESNTNPCGLNENQIRAHGEILAYLQCNGSDLFRHVTKTQLCIVQMYLYHALKKNEALWQLSPSAHSFDISQSYQAVLNRLETHPNEFNSKFVPWFANAPKELQKKLQEVLAAQG